MLSVRKVPICLRDLAGIAQHVVSCAITRLQASNTINNNPRWLHLHLQRALLYVSKGCLRHLAAPPDSARVAPFKGNHQPSYQAALLLLLLLLPLHFTFIFVSSFSVPSSCGRHDSCGVWQVRTAMAIASSLNRTLVMPQLWCGMDRWWAPHDGNIPGSSLQLPFQCPMDHIFDLEQ